MEDENKNNPDVIRTIRDNLQQAYGSDVDQTKIEEYVKATGYSFDELSSLDPVENQIQQNITKALKEGISQDKINAYVSATGANADKLTLDKPEFFGGVSAGIDQIKGTYAGAKGLVATMLDDEEMLNEAKELLLSTDIDREKTLRTGTEWREIGSRKGLDKGVALIDMMQEQTGMLVPQIAEFLGISAATGGVGGLATMGAKQATKVAVKEAAKKYVAPAVFGGVTATGVLSGEQVREGKDIDVGETLLKSMPYAAADVLMAKVLTNPATSELTKKFLSKIDGPIKKNVLGKVTEAIVTGVPSEVIQAGIERSVKDQDLFSDEAFDEYLDTAIYATAGVGPIGVAGGVIGGYQDKNNKFVNNTEGFKSYEESSLGDQPKANTAATPNAIDITEFSAIDKDSRQSPQVVEVEDSPYADVGSLPNTSQGNVDLFEGKFSDGTQEDIFTRRFNHELVKDSKESLNKPLSMSEALVLYPEGVPTNVKESLKPKKNIYSESKGKHGIDFIIDRVRGNNEQVLSRDAWKKVIDQDPFKKPRRDGSLLPWSRSFKGDYNSFFKDYKDDRGLTKYDVIEFLHDLRANKNYPLTRQDIVESIGPDNMDRAKFVPKKGLSKVTKEEIPTNLVQKDVDTIGQYVKTIKESVRTSPELFIERSDTLPSVGLENANKTSSVKAQAALRSTLQLLGKDTKKFVQDILKGKLPSEGKLNQDQSADLRGLASLFSTSSELNKDVDALDKEVFSNFIDWLTYETNFFSKQELKILQEGDASVLKVLSKQGLDPRDFVNGTSLATPEIAYQYFVNRKNNESGKRSKEGNSYKKIDVGSYNKPFNRVYNLLNNLGKRLETFGLKGLEDVYNFDNEQIKQSRDANSKARLDKIIEDYQTNATKTELQHILDHYKPFDINVIPEDNKKSFLKGLMSSDLFNRFSWTSAGLAQDDPILSVFQKNAQAETTTMNMYANEMSVDISDLLRGKDQALMQEIVTWQFKMQESGQKPQILQLQDGTEFVSYLDDNKEIKYIRNGDFIRSLKLLRKRYDFNFRKEDEDIRTSLEEQGLDPDISNNQFKQHIEFLEKSNEWLTGADRLINFETIDTYKEIFNKRIHLTNTNNTEYAPRMRFGDKAIMVLEKTSKSNKELDAILADDSISDVDKEIAKMKYVKRKVLYMGTVEDDLGTGSTNTQLDSHKERMKKLGYGDLNSKEYDIVGYDSPIRLTHNSLARKLGLNSMKDDDKLILMWQLMGKKSIDDLLDGQVSNVTTEMGLKIEDLKKQGLQEVEKYRDTMNKKLRTAIRTGSLMESNHIEGYSLDAVRVAKAAINRDSRMFSRREFSPKFRLLVSLFEERLNAGQISKAREATIRQFIDYIQSDKTDFEVMKAINFVITMGFNASTSLLNMLNGPMGVNSAITQWTNNPIEGNILWGKSWVDTRHLFTKLRVRDGRIEGIYDQKRYDKAVTNGNISRAEATWLRSLVMSGVVSNDVFLEATGGDLDQEATGVKQKFQDFSKMSGSMTSFLEQGSRVNAALTIIRSLSNKDGTLNKKRVNKAVESYNMSGPDFKIFQENNPQYDLISAITAYTIIDTHGDYSKAGRGFSQRGIMGAFVTPFTTFPATQLHLLKELALHRGTSGKMGAIYLLSTYVLLAGAWGVPFGELGKEIFDTIEELSDGTPDDAFLDMQRWLVEEMGFSPAEAAFMHGGPFGAELMDIRRRMTMGHPVQGPILVLLNLLRGRETSAVDLGGPTVGMFGKLAQSFKSGDFSHLLPNAILNVKKAAFDYGTLDEPLGTDKGYRTRTGKTLVKAEEFTEGERIMKAIGFRTAREGGASDANYAILLEKIGKAKQHTRYMNQIGELAYRRLKAQQEGNAIKARKYDLQANELIKKDIELLKKENAYSGRAYRSLLKGVHNRVMMKQNPEMDPNTSKRLKETEQKYNNIYRKE